MRVECFFTTTSSKIIFILKSFLCSSEIIFTNTHPFCRFQTNLENLENYEKKTFLKKVREKLENSEKKN